MDWYRQIDAYCERLGPGFWAEPLNAATNAAFFLAALAGLVLARRERRLDAPMALFVALTAIIGTGSFLFHTYATAWARLADTTPITAFILGYFAIAMNRFAGLGWGRASLLTLAFFAAMMAVSALLDRAAGGVLHGSQGYLPALFALVGVGLWLRGRRLPAATWLLSASAVFAVSLGFRTLDRPLCEAWPIGTHFLWHVLNGVVLGTLLVALVRHGAQPSRLAGRARIA
jgi:Ceramidase